MSHSDIVNFIELDQQVLSMQEAWLKLKAATILNNTYTDAQQNDIFAAWTICMNWLENYTSQVES